MRLEYTVAHVLSALHDELIAAGIAPSYLGDDPDNAPDGIVLEVPDGTDPAAVAAVIAAHDAAAVDAAAAAEQQTDDDDRARVRSAYRNLKDDAAALRNDAATLPATLTAAQVRARLIQIERALAETNDTLAAVVRYLARRLG